MCGATTEHRRRVADYFAGLTRVRRPYYASAVVRRSHQFLKLLRAHLRPGACVLDFGCGTGEITFACAAEGFRTTGFDISAETIAQARRRHENALLTFCNGVPAERASLPLADQSFDAVICSSVLEYCSNPVQELQEICRILRPGGWLFATVPNPWHPIRWFEALAQRTLRILPPARGARSFSKRWRRYSEYLRVSVSRFSLPQWHLLMEKGGLQITGVSKPFSPLCLLIARKMRG